MNAILQVFGLRSSKIPRTIKFDQSKVGMSVLCKSFEIRTNGLPSNVGL